MMRKMNEAEMRKTNAGGYHCDFCGWSTWGKSAMKAHQRAAHGRGSWFAPYAYHFHWRLPVNAKVNCDGSPRW